MDTESLWKALKKRVGPYEKKDNSYSFFDDDFYIWFYFMEKNTKQ